MSGGRDLASARTARGFTLVEIMAVVVIIGLLAAIAIPAFPRIREHSQNTDMANDLRGFAAAFEHYAQEKGGWPVAVAGAFPAEMDGRIKPASWMKPIPGGGFYGFVRNQVGLVAVSLHNTTFSERRLADLDLMLDDGNLATGRFRRYEGFIIFDIHETKP